MDNNIYNIPPQNLLLVFGLVLIVAVIYARWSLNFQTIIYVSFRMIIQLIAVGYILVYIFDSKSPYLICSILAIMLLVASWIALLPLKELRHKLYQKVLFSISIGCLLTLALVIFGVIGITPWYEPRYLIPIAGMIFANAMNTISLAAERFEAESKRNNSYEESRRIAYQAALIPLINSFFAVGLVSLPGMMTGQILAGVSPLIAIRYQIMIMCMLLGSSGISTAVYLSLIKNRS